MQMELRLPEPDALEFLELLQSTPFSAPYAGQVIDWLIRSCSADPSVDRAERAPASRAVAMLWHYSAGSDPGATEIAHRMRDVSHALTLVRAEHYAAYDAPDHAGDGVTALGRQDVRRLCVAAGRSRTLAGPGRAIVIVRHAHEHSVYRPLSAVVRPGSSTRNHEKVGREVLAILAPHVHLADRLSCEGSGVLVEPSREGVRVVWWSPDAALEAGLGHAEPWSAGGLRYLCSALLRSAGMTTSLSDGALLVSR
ncbi:hypothetical protein ACODT5_01095 [Streptomyces sp. 5.8]|uniref:hypothetical protein n=1 Tax=Streptomyces sp. 5.8 TaxID=3406571 RepID=UPI003BB4B53D